jgi:hypothetical protein
MAAQMVQWYLLKLEEVQKAGSSVAVDRLMAVQVAEMAASESNSFAMHVLENRS